MQDAVERAAKAERHERERELEIKTLKQQVYAQAANLVSDKMNRKPTPLPNATVYFNSYSVSLTRAIDFPASHRTAPRSRPFLRNRFAVIEMRCVAGLTWSNCARKMHDLRRR